jgi:hypothetical protein
MHLKPFARRLSLSTAFCLLGTSKKTLASLKEVLQFLHLPPRPSTPTFLFHRQAGHCMYSQYCRALAHLFGWLYQHIYARCWCQQALLLFRPLFVRPSFLTPELLRALQEWTLVPTHGRSGSGFRQNDVLHVFDMKAPRGNSLLKCTYNERLTEMKGQNGKSLYIYIGMNEQKLLKGQTKRVWIFQQNIEFQ